MVNPIQLPPPELTNAEAFGQHFINAGGEAHRFQNLPAVDIGARLNQLLEAVVTVSNRMEERFVGVNRRFDNIDRRIDNMDRRIENMDRRMENMDRRMDNMSGRMNNLETRVTDGFNQSNLHFRSL